MDVRGVGILGDLRIDPEAKREFLLLAGGERLLIEAEASGLVEGLAHLIGRHIYSATPVIGVPASFRAV